MYRFRILSDLALPIQELIVYRSNLSLISESSDFAVRPERKRSSFLFPRLAFRFAAIVVDPALMYRCYSTAVGRLKRRIDLKSIPPMLRLHVHEYEC
jgi:hypothetical protein